MVSGDISQHSCLLLFIALVLLLRLRLLQDSVMQRLLKGEKLDTKVCLMD